MNARELCALLCRSTWHAKAASRIWATAGGSRGMAGLARETVQGYGASLPAYKPSKSSKSSLRLRRRFFTIPAASTSFTSKHTSNSSNTLSTKPALYYSIFRQTLPQGPPPSGPFPIPPRALRSEYLQLQQRLHPDLKNHNNRHNHHHNPPHSPAHTSPLPANVDSSTISKAYSTLLDPLLRAEYILATQSPTSYDPETASSPSPQLLSEVLELREEIEEVAGHKGEISRMITEIQGRIESEAESVGISLERGEWEEAKQGVGRWRYWASMISRLEQLEDELHG